MQGLSRIRFALFAVAALFFSAAAAPAQLNSNSANVNLNAVVNPFVAVAASPATVNFAIPPNGAANGDQPVAITTAWNLQPSVGDLTLWGFFSAAPAALTNGLGSNIPSARVSGSVNGSAFSPFTGNNPFVVGSSLQIFTIRILGNNRVGTRNDTLNLRIDVNGLGLPGGVYTGTLLLQAQAL